jgi:hypothetical protein
MFKLESQETVAQTVSAGQLTIDGQCQNKSRKFCLRDVGIPIPTPKIVESDSRLAVFRGGLTPARSKDFSWVGFLPCSAYDSHSGAFLRPSCRRPHSRR